MLMKTTRPAAPSPNPMLYSFYESPVGRLLLAGDGESLRRIVFPSEKWPGELDTDWRRTDPAFTDVIEQLDAYFAGGLTRFNLSLHPAGTAFQQQVYAALLEIPFGETTTYGAIAKKIGRPKAVRAVGAANGSNPLPVVIPCHRVIGADGSLTGFGGGLEIKRYLLDLEGGQRRLV